MVRRMRHCVEMCVRALSPCHFPGGAGGGRRRSMRRRRRVGLSVSRAARAVRRGAGAADVDNRRMLCGLVLYIVPVAGRCSCMLWFSSYFWRCLFPEHHRAQVFRRCCFRCTERRSPCIRSDGLAAVQTKFGAIYASRQGGQVQRATWAALQTKKAQRNME